ncbi:MAG: cysteine rich repeat-containing protein [Candidatus Contendobacter sp.]|nr:cysteine rich repeat-containing protein [Candidatus Contendobacter sp.]MDG4557098.1 cysteine rich repeat-containing protein [Candidatus Contendobacter sp.]
MTIRKIALALLMSAAVPAFAQQPSQLDQELEMLRAYCKPDIERLCPNVPPGGGKIKECLIQQKMGLSVGCAKALEELKKK